jgi:hypothetical protein
MKDAQIRDGYKAVRTMEEIVANAKQVLTLLHGVSFMVGEDWQKRELVEASLKVLETNVRKSKKAVDCLCDILAEANQTSLEV